MITGNPAAAVNAARELAAGRILVVEDEAVTALEISQTLENAGHSVVARAATGDDAIRQARELRPDIVLMDIRLKGPVDGILAADTIVKEMDAAIIYLTAYADPETLRRAKVSEPYGYIVKPYRETELLAAIEIALHNRAAERALREEHAAAKRSESLIQGIIDNSSAGIYLKDPSGRVTLANRRFEAMFGAARDALRGKRMEDVIPGAPAILVNNDERVMRERAPLLTVDAARGVDQIHLFVALRFPLENGPGCGVGVVLTDVTDLSPRGERVGGDALGDPAQAARLADALGDLNLELERRVRDRTRELAITNDELQTFVRTVSHDLRGPLRGLSGLTEALVADHSKALSPDARGLVSDIHAEAARLSALVNGLLRFSQATGQRLTRETVDLTAIAREAIHQLAVQMDAGEVETRVAEGLQATGDPLLLKIVVENLVANALKFSTSAPHPTIEVGATSIDGERVFFVRDNGIGFRPEEAARLFQPFQRLSSGEGVAGTGLGLSGAARIIERHGGRIWAEGSPGKGATFYFTTAEAPQPR